MRTKFIAQRWKMLVLVTLTLIGIYLTLYAWAVRSGTLVSTYNWSIVDGEEHVFWAPGGVCATPAPPVGDDNFIVKFFSPALWLADLWAAHLGGFDPRPELALIQFRGKLSQKEAKRLLFIQLETDVPGGAEFLGGEFDTSSSFSAVRYRIGQTDFEKWVSSKIGSSDLKQKAPLYFEKGYRGFFHLGITSFGGHLTVWWKDGVLCVRETYPGGTIDRDTDRLNFSE